MVDAVLSNKVGIDFHRELIDLELGLYLSLDVCVVPNCTSKNDGVDSTSNSILLYAMIKAKYNIFFCWFSSV